MDSTPKGWYRRGYLPHFDGQVAQFITFRLFDSLPKQAVARWKAELVFADPEMAADLRKRIESCLDSGHGNCFLNDGRIARMVQNSLIFSHGKRYDLHAWVIMPNHVHMLMHTYENESLASVLHSIKSYSAHEANKILKRSGSFWQHESFDRFIRNERHFLNVVSYIEENPVRAGLCRRPEYWPWSSAAAGRENNF